LSDDIGDIGERLDRLRGNHTFLSSQNSIKTVDEKVMLGDAVCPVSWVKLFLSRPEYRTPHYNVNGQ